MRSLLPVKSRSTASCGALRCSFQVEDRERPQSSGMTSNLRAPVQTTRSSPFSVLFQPPSVKRSVALAFEHGSAQWTRLWSSRSPSANGHGLNRRRNNSRADMHRGDGSEARIGGVSSPIIFPFTSPSSRRSRDSVRGCAATRGGLSSAETHSRRSFTWSLRRRYFEMRKGE